VAYYRNLQRAEQLDPCRGQCSHDGGLFRSAIPQRRQNIFNLDGARRHRRVARTSFCSICGVLAISLECAGTLKATMRGGMIAYVPDSGVYAPSADLENRFALPVGKGEKSGRDPDGSGQAARAPRSALRRHLQYSLERYIRRRLSHHDLKIARDDPPTHVDVEQLEIFRGKLQGYGLRFTRFKRHPLEPPELLDRG